MVRLRGKLVLKNSLFLMWALLPDLLVLRVELFCIKKKLPLYLNSYLRLLRGRESIFIKLYNRVGKSVLNGNIIGFSISVGKKKHRSKNLEHESIELHYSQIHIYFIFFKLVNNVFADILIFIFREKVQWGRDMSGNHSLYVLLQLQV